MNEVEVIVSYSSVSNSIPIISISNSIMKKLKVPTDFPLYFYCSNHSYQVICQLNSSKANIIQIESSLAQKIGIPNQSQLTLRYQIQSRSLHLGPVFAILASGLSKSNPPFARLNAFCEEVIHFAKTRHILTYVVTLAELDKSQGKVKGWTVMQNKWKKAEFPYPQVLYNRLSLKKHEHTNAFKELKKRASEQKLHLFNPTFLNKWEVHSTLEKHDELVPHLPKTHLFEGPLTLKTMIEQYPIIFIKPIFGSLGRGIFRVRRTLHGFQSQFSTSTGQIQRNFKRISHLFGYLNKRINLKKYVIQQGISILHLHERAIDFRALMQKNKSGEWSITSMVARVGSENRFVSNIARGGELGKVGRTLERCKIANPKKVRQKLLHVAKKTCEAIEESNQGQFGELGVDLAVSQSGHVYLLEVNSKPSKTEDSIFLSNSKGRPSVHRLLDYILYLNHHHKK